MLVTSVAVSTLALACASDPPPTAGSPTSAAPTPDATGPTAPSTPPTAPDACSEIAGACHAHDSKGAGASKIHECHELGHAHKLETCAARKQECLEACADHAH